jgi:hypothetical protein
MHFSGILSHFFPSSRSSRISIGASFLKISLGFSDSITLESQL